jgi:hypothetical protein
VLHSFDITAKLSIRNIDAWKIQTNAAIARYKLLLLLFPKYKLASLHQRERGKETAAGL